MKDNFVKFPQTPHLAVLGDVIVRDDKVMSETERNAFLRHELCVEEKVDGANLGVSFDDEGNILVQNRGAYLQLPGPGQWKKLDEWLFPRIDALFEHLLDRYILFGEWCYAKHTVHYEGLPDWFLGFDVYDKKKCRFLSVVRRDKLFTEIGISQVPRLANGRFKLSDLRLLMNESQIGAKKAEGLYLRHDDGEWLVQRAKLVQPDFIQTMEKHWSRSGIKPNKLIESDFDREMKRLEQKNDEE